jgi:hypothetical protein
MIPVGCRIGNIVGFAVAMLQLTDLVHWESRLPVILGLSTCTACVLLAGIRLMRPKTETFAEDFFVFPCTISLLMTCDLTPVLAAVEMVRSFGRPTKESALGLAVFRATLFALAVGSILLRPVVDRILEAYIQKKRKYQEE